MDTSPRRVVVAIAGILAAAAVPRAWGEGSALTHAVEPEKAKAKPQDHGHAPAPKGPAAERPLNADSNETTMGKKPSASAGASGHVAETPPVAAEQEPIDAAHALVLLREGNARWVSNQTATQNLGGPRRESLAETGQHPFVTILTCADSRLPVERVFDRGVGDLFVVRVAGNTAGVSESGTIEYGAEHLHTPLLVVMGHTKCGAVAAAASGARPEGAIGSIVASVRPAVERARKMNPALDDQQIVVAAVRENVWQSILDLLKGSRVARQSVGEGHLTVVGAVYDISTGKVEWLGEHPWQSELIVAFNAREESRTASQASHAEADPH